MNYSIIAKKVRTLIANIISSAGATHIGSCYSIVDVLCVLYDNILKIDSNNHQDPKRDIFILSKGHATAALYCVLCEKGFFSNELLDNYGKNASKLWSHSTANVPGVEISSGALGHGLSIGCGFAFSAKKDFPDKNVFVLVGDGEMNEGSNWEAMLFAAHNKLNNLTFIIDYNKLQGLGQTNEIINLEPLKQKIESFNFNVLEIDGHDYLSIENALKESISRKNDKPSCIICHTTKGKGVDFMENNNAWHYKVIKNEELSNILNQVKWEIDLLNF